MRGQSEPWTEADIAAARLIGGLVCDVVLQSRTVRMLIAHDQLDHVRADVQESRQPVVIADAGGAILLANGAFKALLAPTDKTLDRLSDLPHLFADAHTARERLHDLTGQSRSWRGNVTMAGADGEISLSIRADPIRVSKHRVLGFVLIFADTVERKAAILARAQFQDGILEHNRQINGLLTSKDDLLFQTLLVAIVENAQLAALEITDRADTTRMPQMLDSVRNSVRRTTVLLRHLFRHRKRALSPDRIRQAEDREGYRSETGQG